MALKQLNVFVENKRGSIVEITKALVDKNVDIRALSIADTEEFGILRMIVNDVDAAHDALSSLGCIVNISEVVGLKIGDAPGKLSQVLEVLDNAGINVEYLYAFLMRTDRHAYVVLRVADNDVAESVLTVAGFHLISDADVCKL